MYIPPLNDLYEATVAIMVIGGWVVSGLLLLWAGIVTLTIRHAAGAEPGHSRQSIHDGWLILGVSAIPQMLVCLIPVFYWPWVSVPGNWVEACVICGVSVLVLWTWALAKLLSSAVKLRAWMFAPLVIPSLASIPALVGVYILH